MKRLICVLLTLALLCAVPVLALPAAAAGEADYDALYVQDGMTMWLDAYNPAQSINFTTGQWTSKVGSGSATLATPSFWTAAQGGGVGFAMHSYETFRDNYTRVGVDLGIANLPSGNFTVEFVYRMDGLVDEAGQDIPHNTEMNGNKWGLYTANQSAWVFGAAHFMQFMKSESPSGASLRTRLMYGLTQAYDNAHWLNDFTNFTEKNLHKATRHRVTYEQTEGGTYGTTAHYQWYNGENRVVDFCNETTTDPDGQAYYSNAEGGFKLMYGTPV